MFHGQLAIDNDFHGQNNFFLDCPYSWTFSIFHGLFFGKAVHDTSQFITLNTILN
jgi:hypothetical protein